MKIKVRDKEFKIELVNNYVHQLYQEITDISKEIVEEVEKLKELTEEYLKNKTKETEKNLNELGKKLNIYRKEKTKELYDLRMEIIQEVLTTNNYEYDSVWWLKRTEPNDLNDFMITCINKDKMDGTKNDTKK